MYRFLVALTLALLFLFGGNLTRLGQGDPTAFWWVVQAYTALNLLVLVAVNYLPTHWLRLQLTVIVVVGLDILALCALTYLSNGVASGLAPLLLVSVAAGAILAASKVSTLLAALASLGLLYTEGLLSTASSTSQDGVFQAGLFGVLFFVAAIAIAWISQRLRDAETRALAQALELEDLERVNRRIIRRMRTGILVLDKDDQVRTGNQSAFALLGLARNPDSTRSSGDLPEVLLNHVTAWRSDTNYRARPFQAASETPEIRANFSAVRAGSTDAEVIVFLEDTSEIQQHAQQLKLAALGRLSASIAHEIRNPLGAITHAAQLLAESDNLDAADTRLTDIINNHGRRMNRVIENILELSRRRAPDPVRLNLLSLLEDFVTQFLVGDQEDADIEIQVKPATTEVRIDRSQLLQVLTNLVQNGLRYSLQHSGRATVSLQGGIDSATDRPYLNVIDDGPGVDSTHQAKLFDPFFTTEQSGTGLGLYIAREMCEANQARLGYLEAADRGGCFRITFAHPDRITG